MAQIINTETPAYINKNIEVYTENKYGQYSKYLDKNPLFWTLYMINPERSRADLGTENINCEIGKSSPLRFNRVKNFPLFNVPEFKPDITYDETGYDAQLELSGVIGLPGTCYPDPSSYLKYEIPGTNVAMLFRLNDIQWSTIQANDYTSLTMVLKRSGDIGSDYIEEIEKQVVEKYVCVYENIGTKDNCIIKEENIEGANNLQNLIKELTEQYFNLFFFPDTEDFLLTILPGARIHYLYDIYVTRFINESLIFENAYDDRTVVLPYNEVTPFNFDYLFRGTLYWAVMKRSLTYLRPHNCYYGRPIQMTFSPYKQGGYMCYSTVLNLLDTKFTSCPCDEFRVEEYFHEDLLESLTKNEMNTNMPYYDQLIYHYLTEETPELDYDKLLELTYEPNMQNFIYLPIIIYILMQYHKGYFTTFQS